MNAATAIVEETKGVYGWVIISFIAYLVALLLFYQPYPFIFDLILATLVGAGLVYLMPDYAKAMVKYTDKYLSRQELDFLLYPLLVVLVGAVYRPHAPAFTLVIVSVVVASFYYMAKNYL